MKLSNNLDVRLWQLLNARAENRGGDPAFAAGEAGRFWLRAGHLRFNDGTQITTLRDTQTPIVNGDIDAAAAIALSKLATDPLARANHTGTQLAATISDFVAARDLQRLDQHAVPTAAVPLNAQKITGLADPTAAQDAATKAYVDANAQGLSVKAPVRVASTANVNKAAPGANVDGVAMVAGERILLLAQAAGEDNGPWVWNGAAAALTRPLDFDTSAEAVPGSFIFVQEGTNADNGFVLATNAPINLGVTALTFTQFSGAGQITAGAALTKTGNTLDVADGNGITTAGDAVAADLLANGGLEFSGGQIAVDVDDSSIERVAGGIRVKAGGITEAMLADNSVTLDDSNGTITGTLAVANGGTGSTTAPTARTALAAAGRFDNGGVHAALATITIAAATHGLGAGRSKDVTVIELATGDQVYPDVNVAANGDVVCTFGAAIGANTHHVLITGW